MNQKYLILKATDDAGGTEYEYVTEIMCERTDARQRAGEVIAEDGTFYCVPLGDKIVACTTRVISGVKSTRSKSTPATKTAKQPRKKKGLSPEAKIEKRGDVIATT